MEVVYNGKIVGKFLDFADNGDYLIVLTKDGSKKVFWHRSALFVATMSDVIGSHRGQSRRCKMLVSQIYKFASLW